MTEISPINVNTQSITNNEQQKAKAQSEETKQEQEVQKQPEQKSVSADEVLNFLANTAIVTNIKRTNTAGTEARIASLMEEFEAGVVAGLAKFEEEMGAVPAFQKLSEADKMALAAELFISEAE